MALENVANTDCVISHDVGSTITGGTFTITSVASTKVKALGKGVYFQQIDFTFAGGSAPGVTPGTVTGSGTIVATAIKVKSLTQAVVRENDTGTLSGTGTNPAPPPPTLPVTGPVIISSGGQTKVKAQ